jgi:hypothetical protein
MDLDNVHVMPPDVKTKGVSNDNSRVGEKRDVVGDCINNTTHNKQTVKEEFDGREASTMHSI